jgi:tRNA nucleotidyltransferase/poly(A) polymerase
LLGEDCLDWDIVTPGDAHTIARQLASALGGHYVHMHEKASRVVVPVEDTGSLAKKKEVCIDISPLTGKTLEEDLRHRDFTVNAIAAPLDEVVLYLESYEIPSTSAPSAGARAVNGEQVGLNSRPPWFAWKRWLSTHKSHSHPRATIKAHPTSSQPPSPPQYNEDTNLYIGGAPLTGVPEDGDGLGAISNVAGLRANMANTLAHGLGSLSSQLIDPLNGLADLQIRHLKAVDDQIFRHDPLRMLRAVRLMMRYQLQIETWTASLITRDAGLLPEVAPERVHDELYAIFGLDGAANRLHFLDEHGLFMVIFPEFAPARGMPQPNPHYWDVLTHSIETVDALEQIAHLLQNKTAYLHSNVNVGSPLAGALGTEMGMDNDLAEITLLLKVAEQQGIFSFAGLTAPRMKMAALLHDIGKPVTYSCDQEGAIHFYNHPMAGVPLVEQVMRRLCASTHDRRLAQLVAAHHMRPGQLGYDGPVTQRAIRRYFVDLGPTGIYVALFSLADHLATLGPQPIAGSWKRHLSVVHLLLTRYIRERESILPPRLISPEELMRRLKLEPGPIIGQLLDLISEAQAEGTIHSKEEAVWFAEEHLTTLS